MIRVIRNFLHGLAWDLRSKYHMPIETAQKLARNYVISTVLIVLAFVNLIAGFVMWAGNAKPTYLMIALLGFVILGFLGKAIHNVTYQSCNDWRVYIAEQKLNTSK